LPDHESGRIQAWIDGKQVRHRNVKSLPDPAERVATAYDIDAQLVKRTGRGIGRDQEMLAAVKICSFNRPPRFGRNLRVGCGTSQPNTQRKGDHKVAQDQERWRRMRSRLANAIRPGGLEESHHYAEGLSGGPGFARGCGGDTGGGEGFFWPARTHSTTTSTTTPTTTAMKRRNIRITTISGHPRNAKELTVLS
jgi:hypothetical protein